MALTFRLEPAVPKIGCEPCGPGSSKRPVAVLGAKRCSTVPPRVAEFCCKNVWQRGKPVLYVCHDRDGDWQLLCGGYEHEDDNEIMVLHKDHLIERDPSLVAAMDLPRGWQSARSSVDDAWTRDLLEEDDDEAD